VCPSNQLFPYSVSYDVEQTAPNSSPRPIRERYLPWAELLKRVFSIDVLVCEKCAAAMRIIAFINDPGVILKILEHLKLESTPPAIEPSRFEQPQDLPEIDGHHEPIDHDLDCPTNPLPRGPPPQLHFSFHKGD